MPQTYNYPPNIEELGHWMEFTAWDYKQTMAASKWSCALYLPPDALSTSYKSDYEAAALGAFGGMTDEVLQKSGGNIDGLKATLAAQGAVLSSSGMDMLAAGASNETAKILMSRSKGMVKNPYIVAAYKGPSDMRSHKFTFSFNPKNPTESQQVTSIINKFKASMLPAWVGGNNKTAPTGLMGYPDKFKIEYIINGRRLPQNTSNPMFRIGESVLTTCDVSYTTQDVPLFFEGTQNPVFAEMALEFMEMQVMTRDKIEGINAGASNQYGQGGGH